MGVGIGIQYVHLLQHNIGVIRNEGPGGDEEGGFVGERSRGSGPDVAKGVFQADGGGVVLNAYGGIVAVGIGIPVAEVDIVELLVLELDLAVTSVGGVVNRIVEDSLEGLGSSGIVAGDEIVPLHHVIVLGAVVPSVNTAAGLEVQVVPEDGDHGAGASGIRKAPVAPIGIVGFAKGNKTVGTDGGLAVIHSVKLEGERQIHGLDGHGPQLVTFVATAAGISEVEGGAAAPFRWGNADPVVNGALFIASVAFVEDEIAVGVLTEGVGDAGLADGEGEGDALLETIRVR
ncbi:MAG: hypothetical protein BWX83_00750 [Candidatus Cloacimonetes bacterium ADurb.Bin117]|nr:MAG: hypothetical protein BWX83_00750 [Candidatus Cloacimonetes bacterium ADurb.Bin117]